MERIIYEAYCNELANDKFGITLTDKRSKYNNNFYFKNYKITNLSDKKFYFFYTLSIFYKKIWLISIIYFTFQFIVSIFILKKDSKILKNIAFIDGQKSFYDISLIKVNNLEYLKKSFFSFSVYLSFYDKFLAYLMVLKVIYIITKRKKISGIEYHSLKFHIYDLYLLSLFSLILKDKEIVFYTNSHYDRWIYIASKLNNISLNIIQHGFLTKDIDFPFKFGIIEVLYVYDKEFVVLFRYHYTTIKIVKFIKPNLELKQINSIGYKSIFIASSMISINLEKDIINWLLLKNKYKIYIKLHPAYNYRDKFAEYGNNIEFIDYFPKVDCMVSYNSFLGYEYKALGENVLWINNYKDNLNNLYKELELTK